MIATSTRRSARSADPKISRPFTAAADLPNTSVSAMRPLFALILLPLAGCTAVPDFAAIPAPWESTENQFAEPAPPAPDAAVPPWTRIGSSIRGKPIEALSLGAGKLRIYVLGGLHGDQPEGPQVAARLPAALLPAIVGPAGERATIRIVRDANPDGTALNQRGNTRGVDLNRNFPTKDFRSESLPGRLQGPRPASELETTALLEDLKAFKPDLVIVFRTAPAGRGPVVNFDGPGLTRAYDFASAARAEDPRWRVSTDKSFINPGSIDSLVARDMNKPVLSVEFRRGDDPAHLVKAVRAGIAALAGNDKPAATHAPAEAAATIREPVLGGRP